MKDNTNENLHMPNFLKHVLQQIMKNKTGGNITSHSTPRPSYYSAPTAEQLPLIKKRKNSPSSPKRSGKEKQLSLPFGAKEKQLTLPLHTARKAAVANVPKVYTNADKWMSDNFDKNWRYVGYDLTGYPTDILPDETYTTGNVLKNVIYQEAILANPDVFMDDWNDALKRKIADEKKKLRKSRRGTASVDTNPPQPPQEDEGGNVNVNEIMSMIKEIVAEELSEVNYTQDDSGKPIVAQGAPGSVIRFATENPKLIAYMREWVKDCQWADLQEDDVDDLSEEELLRGIQKNYDGGIRAFIQDALSTAEVPVGYKESLKETYYGMDPDDGHDGYSNEFQRAFAHSQATTPRKNEMDKAKDLAKQGKYVIVAEYPVHCRSTDACLGTEKTIYKVFDDAHDVAKEWEKIHTEDPHDTSYHLVTPPESIKEPKQQPPTTPPPSTGGDDDVPFEEGVGYVYDKDMKKDPKHIPGERWRVKFQENINSPEKEYLMAVYQGAKDEGNAEAATYYSQLLQNVPKSPVSFDKFKTSSSYGEWKRQNAQAIAQAGKQTSNPWLAEVKKMIKEIIISESLHEEGKPIPKDPTQIAGLIHKLKEGEAIWFSYDIKGHSQHGYGVECKAEGDYLIHRTIGEYGEYLETEEEIDQYAKNVAADKYIHYYFYQSIQGYKKHDWTRDHDDQSPGHYEMYGPDRPTWQDIYESTRPLNEIIKGYDDMIALIKEMSPEEQEELNLYVKQKGGSAYEAVLSYFQEKAKAKQS